MLRLLLVDNYDSFSHNLAHVLRKAGAEVAVVLNDAMTVREVEAARFDGIVLSPGPSTPDDAGVTLALVERLGGHVPLLGVCLGMQAIAQAHGARIVRAPTPRHGRASPVVHDGRGAFAGLPSPFLAGRYHSLAVDAATLPSHLAVTAHASDDGVVMALYDRGRELEGFQFHPESVLTPLGEQLVARWVGRIEARRNATGSS